MAAKLPCPVLVEIGKPGPLYGILLEWRPRRDHMDRQLWDGLVVFALNGPASWEIITRWLPWTEITPVTGTPSGVRRQPPGE